MSPGYDALVSPSLAYSVPDSSKVLTRCSKLQSSESTVFASSLPDKHPQCNCNRRLRPTASLSVPLVCCRYQQGCRMQCCLRTCREG